MGSQDRRIPGRRSSPAERILAIFDALAELFAQPDFGGCAFINAAAEAPHESAEAIAAQDFRGWLHGLFRALVDDGGFTDPEALAAQLVLLYDGSNISAHMDNNPQAAALARGAAAALMSAADRGTAPTNKRTRARRR